MSVEKKDLTRIEDLGEFLHQLDEPDSYLPDLPEEAALDSLPDLPAEEPTEESGDLSFGTEEPAGLENEFTSQPESEPAFEASSEAEADPFAFSDSAAQMDEVEETSFSGGIQEMVDETFSTPENTNFEENTSFHEDSPLSSELASEMDNFERAQKIEEPEVYKPKEDFQDTKSFTEHAVLTDLAAECNPPFSVIAKNIRYLEDSEEIIVLLKEIGFPEDMLGQFKRQIERGTLLVPRISEYAAIYLCHKLRHLKIDLTLGLSDILHPPRHTSELDRGLVSKRSLTQNQVHKFDFKTDTADAKNIILSTLTHLEGHTIEKYLGMATEHSFLESHLVESEASDMIHQSYDELAQKLKAHALENKANAVLGINYQLTPMPSDQGMGQFRYKLTCTGNLVYLFKLNTHA